MQKRSSSSTRQPINSGAHRMNMMQLKEQEAINKERTRQDDYNRERQTRVTQQLAQPYNNVGSRVNMTGHVAPKQQPQSAVPQDRLAQPKKAPVDDVEIKVFVRECDGEDASVYTMLESQGQQLAGGAGQDGPYKVQPQQKASGAGGARPPLARSNANDQSAVKEQGKRGEVPRYLQERKAHMQAEQAEIERAKAEEAEKSKYPPGHRPFTEEERTELLQKLSSRKKELEYDLVRIPVRIDTIAVKKRRQQIETELEEVETAMQKFSVKKQLFVPC